MNSNPLNILLADDDIDDCNFFKKAVSELKISSQINVVHNGEQLMKQLIVRSEQLPDVLFLDLNMPRKNGLECLSEIKKNERLKQIFVILYSTAYPRDPYYQRNMINMLYQYGAHHYIRKPYDFSQLKLAIQEALIMVTENIRLKRQGKNSLVTTKTEKVLSEF
jgi:CheY-like chemotaxis protein